MTVQYTLSLLYKVNWVCIKVNWVCIALSFCFNDWVVLQLKYTSLNCSTIPKIEYQMFWLPNGNLPQWKLTDKLIQQTWQWPEVITEKAEKYISGVLHAYWVLTMCTWLHVSCWHACGSWPCSLLMVWAWCRSPGLVPTLMCDHLWLPDSAMHTQCNL